MKPTHVGAILAFICAVAFWQLGQIPESAIQMAVGPSAAPRAVVAFFAVVTVLYCISAWRGRQVDDSLEPEQSALPGATLRLLSLFAGGLVFIAGVTWAGFVLPATLCGMLVARGFDAPLGLKSALICMGISVTLWALFAKALGVGLGPATPFGF
jgi:Tripartite tricarboxylate transporter TctB family